MNQAPSLTSTVVGTQTPRSASTAVLRLKSRETLLLEKLRAKQLLTEDVQAVLSGDASPEKKGLALCHLLNRVVRPAFPDRLGEGEFIELELDIRETVQSLGLDPEKIFRRYRKIEGKLFKERQTEALECCFARMAQVEILATEQRFAASEDLLEQLKKRALDLLESRSNSSVASTGRVNAIGAKINKAVVQIDRIRERIVRADDAICSERARFDEILDRMDELIGKIE